MTFDLSFILGLLGSVAVFGTAEYVYTRNYVDTAKAVYTSLILLPVTFLHEGAHLVAAEMLGARVERACLRLNSDFGRPAGAYVEARWTSKTVRTLAAVAPVLMLLPLALYLLAARPFHAGWLNSSMAVVCLLATMLSDADKAQAKSGLRAMLLAVFAIGLAGLAGWALMSGIAPGDPHSIASVLAKNG